MSDPSLKPLSLEVVPPLLEAIRQAVGCEVDSYAVTMDGNTWLHLDVADYAFAGVIDAPALKRALCVAAVAACGQKLSFLRDCTNEGCLITLYLTRDHAGYLYLEVGL